jgi:hypothetical protein
MVRSLVENAKEKAQARGVLAGARPQFDSCDGARGDTFVDLFCPPAHPSPPCRTRSSRPLTKAKATRRLPTSS